MNRLEGTTSVVTGASRGIGLAITRHLVAHGARVVLLARGESALREAAAALGPRAIPLRCDVSRADDVAAAISRIRETFGGAPGLVVNNAGAFDLTAIETLDPALLSRSLETNLVAPLRFIHAFLTDMHKRRAGHIVTIGSMADRQVFPGNAAYASAKYGMRALHEVLRLETRGTGVRATLVSPAQVDTPLWNAIDPDNREGFTPRAQMLDADAVAAAVLYAVTQPPSVNVDELRLSRA